MNSVAIGELVHEVQSWSPQRDAPTEQLKYIDLSAVDNDAKVVTSHQTVLGESAPSRAKQLVRAGDILVSTVRPYLNGVARVPKSLNGATASTGFCVIRANVLKASPEYLFQWVKSPLFVADMTKKATGASYPAVSDRIVFESEIPLPSLDEQRRIAAILDQADALRRKRLRTLDRLGDLPVSMFKQMFGSPIRNERGWPIVILGRLTNKIGSGATPTGGEAAYKNSGITLIRSMNVHDGEFVTKGLAYLDDDQAKRLDNVVVESGDVLLNITGASVARVCRVPASVLPARVNQHVSIIRANEQLLSAFLEVALLHPDSKMKLLRIGEAGATRQAITKAQIEEFAMIVPPIHLQNEFDQRLGMVLAALSGAERQRAGLESLFFSLQSRAFGTIFSSAKIALEAAE